MKIGYGSRIIADFEMPESVKIAVDAALRDIKNTSEEIGKSAENEKSSESEQSFASIVLQTVSDENIQAECYVVCVTDSTTAAQQLTITASDDLGLIYGLYHISKTFIII